MQLLEPGQMSTIDLRTSLELTSSLIDQLHKAFVELEGHEDAPGSNVQWDEVEVHFRSLASVLNQKLEEVDVKEKIFAKKESLLAEREAEVIAKEQDLLDKVQELKDAAVSAIMEARAEFKVICTAGDDNANHESNVSAEVVAEVNAKLTQFCEQMDSKGLLNYVTDNLNSLSCVCRQQFSVVLGSATDPALLVLDSLEGFFPLNEMPLHGDNGDSVLHCRRQSCLLLMEALSAFLAKADSTDGILSPEIKQYAKAIADVWKPKLALASLDAADEKSLEARAFLRLLVTFRIVSEYDEEELCKYILATAHHRQATELCRNLELTQRVPGLVETLMKNGKNMEAVNFILSFEMSEAFPPVPLLKTYLKDVRRNLQGNGDPDMQNECNCRELSAVKAVMRCVKEYKLEDEYPLDPLRKRFLQLQRTVWDRKRKREGKFRLPRESRGKGKLRRTEPDVPSNEQGSNPYFWETVANSGTASTFAPAGSSVYDHSGSSMPPYAAQANLHSGYYFPAPSQSAYFSGTNDQQTYYYGVDNVASTNSAGGPGHVVSMGPAL